MIRSIIKNIASAIFLYLRNFDEIQSLISNKNTFILATGQKI